MSAHVLSDVSSPPTQLLPTLLVATFTASAASLSSSASPAAPSGGLSMTMSEDGFT